MGQMIGFKKHRYTLSMDPSWVFVEKSIIKSARRMASRRGEVWKMQDNQSGQIIATLHDLGPQMVV